MLRSHCWKFPCPLSLTGSAGPARNLTTDASSSISPEVQAAMRSVLPLGQPTFKSMLPTPPLGPLPPAPVPGAWQPPRPAAAQPAPEVAAEEAAPAQDAGAAGWDGGDMPLPAAEAEAGAEAAEQEYEPYPQPGMGEPGEGWGGGELDAEGGAAVQPHMEQYGEAAAQQYDGQQYGGDWGAAGGWGSGEGDAEGGAAAAAAEYGAEAGAEQYQQQDQGYYSQEYYAQGYAGGEEGGYAGQVRQAREVCDGTRADSRHKSRLQHSKTMPCRIHTSTLSMCCPCCCASCCRRPPMAARRSPTARRQLGRLPHRLRTWLWQTSWHMWLRPCRRRLCQSLRRPSRRLEPCRPRRLCGHLQVRHHLYTCGAGAVRWCGRLALCPCRITCTCAPTS